MRLVREILEKRAQGRDLSRTRCRHQTDFAVIGIHVLGAILYGVHQKVVGIGQSNGLDICNINVFDWNFIKGNIIDFAAFLLDIAEKHAEIQIIFFYRLGRGTLDRLYIGQKIV